MSPRVHKIVKNESVEPSERLQTDNVPEHQGDDDPEELNPKQSLGDLALGDI